MKFISYKACKRGVAVLMTFTMVSLSTGRADAALAPATMETQSVSAARAADLANVRTFLERKEVRQQLSGLGLSEQEIDFRLDNLSDSELRHVSSKIDQQRPAADGGGIIITVLVIGVLALLFVYLLKRV